MKRVIALTISMLLLLSACDQSLKYSAPGWELQVSSPTSYNLEDYGSICSEYTNVKANFRSLEGEGTQLILVECTDFTIGIYTDENNTYTVTADNLQCACDGLSQVVDAYSLAQTTPTVYTAVSDVTSAIDGWGVRTVNGESFAWPENSTSSLTGWQTDDATFEVVQYTEKEDATEDLEAMKASVEANNITGFKMWYYSAGSYQGLAWLLDGEYYISLALYRQSNTMYLTLAGQDNMDYALELAEKYNMEAGMKDMLSSEPIYER